MAKPPAALAVDFDIRTEHVIEPETPPAPEPASKSKPPKTETRRRTELEPEAPKTKPKRTTQRKRRGFDDDMGSPEIEIF